MDTKIKKIILKARVNKANGQISFDLKKSSLPIRIKHKLPELKSIKLKLEDFEF